MVDENGLIIGPGMRSFRRRNVYQPDAFDRSLGVNRQRVAVSSATLPADAHPFADMLHQSVRFRRSPMSSCYRTSRAAWVEYGVSPQARVVFEITETATIANMNRRASP